MAVDAAALGAARAAPAVAPAKPNRLAPGAAAAAEGRGRPVALGRALEPRRSMMCKKMDTKD